MDDGADPADDDPDHEPGRSGGRILRRAEQRVRVVGPAVRESVLRVLGDSASVSVPERSDGAAESDPHHCCAVVGASGVCFLSDMGEDRPLRQHQ